MKSPYANYPEEQWKTITKQLVASHPLKKEEIVKAVLESWEGIMRTKIADELQIGVDIFPQPQILGNFLHELIPVMLEKEHPGKWARDRSKKEKDLVYIPDSYYSTEIKTSSNRNNIFGNASYGQEDSSKSTSKLKDGYYLTVNFQKFDPENPGFKPRIQKIRLCWLDHTDWHSQKASSGQQARIKPTVRDNKLLLIYDIDRGGTLV